MNRWDEIQAAARDVADWVDLNPDQRNQMADDLIKLVGLMIQATGKCVAVEGESAMNEPGLGDDSAFARYLVGERLQDGAREVVEESAGADIERYERDGLTPAWVSRRDKPRDPQVSLTQWASNPQQQDASSPRPSLADCGAVDGSDLDACGICQYCRHA